jgi:Phage integrase, N-terminal SAM-like domain
VSSARASKRRRGAISWLPSGSARVKVYLGVDQLTGQEIWLRETIKARSTKRETEREAEKVITKLLNQVDERRSPKTEATVNELLDRWLEVLDVEKTTRTGYVGKIEKHIRPTLGRLQVARVRAETVENLYAQLRRCRDHCKGRKFVQHRTEGEHACDELPAAVCEGHERRLRGAVQVVREGLRAAPVRSAVAGQHSRRPRDPQRRFHTRCAMGLDRGQPYRPDRAAADAAAEPITAYGRRGSADPRRGMEGPALGRLHPVHHDDWRPARRGLRPPLVTARPRHWCRRIQSQHRANRG